ncbi:MAG: efflux RND transporter periplasmic adaptor subunit [Ginsengibacter sp.]
MSKINNAILLLLFPTVLLFSCKGDSSTADTKSKYVIPDSLLKTLNIDSVITCPMVSTITLTGKVSFNEEKMAKIFPMVSGNITGVTTQLGDYVTAHQKLGTIKSGEIIGLGNDLVTSKTNLLIAKKNLDASEDMYKGGLLSQKDLITVQQLYKQAESELRKSSSILQINGGNSQGDFIVKAPISGFIVEKDVNNNMYIRSDNSTSIFTISDLKNVWVLANVYESNIGKVHLGDEVNVTTIAYPDRIFKGTIDKIFNVLDPTNKVMKIRVVLPNVDYALKPEMFASVNVVVNSGDNALCIPSSALIFDQSQYYVLVYKSRSDVRIIPVNVINSNGNKSYVSGNVKVGDKIISSNVVLMYGALNS